MVRSSLRVALFLGAVAGLTAQSSRAADHVVPCPAPCADPCAVPCHPGYIEQVVTAQKAEWKTKKVEVTVVEYSWVDKPVKYTVCELVKDKQKAKVCKIVETKEPFKYTVNEMKLVKDKVKVCEHVWTEKDEPYSFYEPVTTIQKMKKMVCETVCVPTQVTCCVPVPSCCGCTLQPVTHTVMRPTVVTKEVEYDAHVCNLVKKDGVRKVKVCTPTWTEKEMDVWKCVAVEKTGERIVCTPTWVEVDVDVWVQKMVEKDGVRKECVSKEVKKVVDQAYCEWVTYQTVVKVPVPAPCYVPVAACPAPCADPCKAEAPAKRKGLLARLFGR